LPNYNNQHSIVPITKDIYNLILSDREKKEKGEAIMNKDTIYQRIRQECINRNLTFKDISEEIKTGVEYGFIISDEATGISIYGNILSNKIEGDKIYQAITKTLYDFYDLNKGKNFVVVIDSIQNHFLTIPFNILKDVMYDRESGKDINKNFHISRNPYTLQRNKASLFQYVDNLDVLFALDTLITRIHYTVDEIEKIERRLIDKRQIIFYGPPGTGKTHVAIAFGEYFTGSKDNVEVIQFHPSYSYEDFIEGIRPNENGGFSKRPGIFKRFVDEKCSNNLDKRFLLIIDEINRGDIARIFGELTHLLLNRDKKITLTYSSTLDEKFSIPSNLYILATMNSQDRSIAFLDYANRRRFSWIKFEPRYDILSNWLEKNSDLPIKSIVKEGLEATNELLRMKLGEDYEIGHSYFMEDKLDEQKLKDIIEYEIKPLTKQYFFAKKDEEFLKKINQHFDRMVEAQSLDTRV
jgi:5-methylcytosine-specific restriction endonuclease McrBC GTP-binding regulatory subunit McrB